MNSPEPRGGQTQTAQAYAQPREDVDLSLPLTESPAGQSLVQTAWTASNARTHTSLLNEFLAEPNELRKLKAWFGGESLRKRLTESGQWVADQLDRDIATIDHMIEKQINAILHAQQFQRLESAWRGIEYLVNKRDEYATAPILIKVLNVSWIELRNDVEAANEFDQSQMFKKVYEEGLGTPGADPFSVLIADYSIHPRPSREHPVDDIFILRSLSQIAAAAFCPLIINADPSMFGSDSFTDLRSTVNIESLHAGLDYFSWQRFRESEDSRFVSLAMPKMLMRRPYRDRYDLGFPFREIIRGREDYLWGGAAFAMGEVLLRAFADSRWLGNIRGAQRGLEAGGVVTGPVMDTFSTEPFENAVKSLTDIVLPDEFERELAGGGFLPLCACKDMPLAAFYSCVSAQKPKQYNSAEAAINARLSTLLNYMLCVSRFAHYIKIISRDKIGSCATPEELQSHLQSWVIEYVSSDPNASISTRARRPLIDAEVRVRAIPGTAGEYGCVLHLAPHYELDDMRVSIRLDTQLAQPVQ